VTEVGTQCLERGAQGRLERFDGKRSAVRQVSQKKSRCHRIAHESVKHIPDNRQYIDRLLRLGLLPASNQCKAFDRLAQHSSVQLTFAAEVV